MIPLDDRSEIAEAARLIVLARQGDTSAFARLMQRHERQVLGTAARILHNFDEARDAAQEVFLKLYRNLGRIRSDADLRPWLYRVTVNVCRDLLRKSRRSWSAPLEDETFVAGGSTDESLAADERRRILTAALETLPFKERAALVLRDIEGFGTGETARVLGSSQTTVRSQVASARIKIKRYVDRALRRKL